MGPVRVFVTGATGAVGQPAVQALLGAGHHVTGVARSTEKADLLRSLGAEPVHVDLFDADAVAAAIAGHDAVANLATKIPPTSKAALKRSWQENERIRREASAHVADAVLASAAGRLVQESIAFAYAEGSGDEWLDEDTPLDLPPGFDALEVAEANAKRVTEGGKVGVVLRFGNFYGPGAAHSQDWVRLARRRLPGTMGDPAGYWPTIHLDDAGRAVVAALDAPAGTYNVVDDEPLTKEQMGLVMAEAAGAKPPRQMPKVADKLATSRAPMLGRSLRVSNRRFEEATGWAPDHPSFREGWGPTAAALS